LNDKRVPPNGNGKKFDRTLAHELNLELLNLISYRQERRFKLSAYLLSAKIVVVVGLLMLGWHGQNINETVENLLLVLVTGLATSTSTLAGYWFNQQSSTEDSKLVAEATSYDLGLEQEDDANGK
tara:strand:- start:268 stop:642 length:375 start_codon:yes stop_codon:yes gene_type:complete